jgi:hypothetical protein
MESEFGDVIFDDSTPVSKHKPEDAGTPIKKIHQAFSVKTKLAN